jgi:hypothetical protein
MRDKAQGLDDKRIWQSCSQHSQELRGDPAGQYLPLPHSKQAYVHQGKKVGITGDVPNHRSSSYAREADRATQ